MNTSEKLYTEEQVQLKIQAHQISDIYQKLDTMDKKLDKLDNRGDKLDSRIDRLEDKIDKLDSKFTNFFIGLISIVISGFIMPSLPRILTYLGWA